MKTAKKAKLRHLKKLKRKIRRKQRFALMVLTVLIMALFGRTAYIYVVHGEDFERRAVRQQVTERGVDLTITPNRGSIVDRNGQPLAVSNVVYNVILDVRLLFEEYNENNNKVQEDTVNAIYEVLGIEKDRIWGYIMENPETGTAMRDTHYLVLERMVSRQTANELIDFYPAPTHVWLEEDTLRSYPNGASTGPLVGFLRGDDSHWGLERSFNDALSGEPGRRVRLFNAQGVPITAEHRPTPGHTIVTTLDLSLQRKAVEIAQRYGQGHRAQSAQVLVMNPNTGAILAMAQYPTFDPNDPGNLELINSVALREAMGRLEGEELTNALFGLWGNHATSRSFEPGSTFKAIIGAAAMEEGLVGPNEVFFCSGSSRVLGETIHCFVRTGHGSINVVDGVARSCNPVFMEIGSRLGRQRFYDYLRDFGIGQTTGIDLHGESSFFPLTYSVSQLNPVEIATSSIGQGFNISAIQLTNAFAAVINGGYLMQPHLVAQVVDADNNIVSETTGVVRRNLLSRETSDFWRTAMIETMSPQTRGTGVGARIEGFSIGGKTGTGEQGTRLDNEYVVSFLGYLPAHDPQYLVLVLIDRPAGGESAIRGVISAMLREMMEYIIISGGILPEGVTEDPRQSISVLVENYVGGTLVDASRRLAEKGLRFETVGNGGTVINQQPLVGAQMPQGSRVLLYMSNDSGEDLVPVPDVRGMTIQEAMSALRQVGLSFTILETPTNNTRSVLLEDETIVVGQQPTNGNRVPVDSEVTLIF